ncbi:MAG: glycosyltransferase [Candidatus Aenigmarchaeota archaeon]|nr:glycosyltransferase [Candidatus Aenigmarchaeota archaeon]
MNSKKVSIIVPTYNRSGDIKKAVESLMEIDYPDYEIIVVDDASKDNTSEVLKKFGNKIRLIVRKKNGGPAAARNDGIRAAKGRFIAFTDSDCTVSRNWIKTLVKFLNTFKLPDNVAGVCGTIYPPKDANFLMKLIYFMPQMDGNTMLAEKKNKPFQVNNISCNNAVWRADVIKKMRSFDESFFKNFRAVPEDSELCYRTLKSGYKFYMYPGAETYHHFRPTLKEFLKQSYRAGRGGGVVLLKHKDWFGWQTPLIFGFIPVLFYPAAWPFVALFGIYISSPILTRPNMDIFEKITLFLAAIPLWILKSTANVIGFWEGLFEAVTKRLEK